MKDYTKCDFAAIVGAEVTIEIKGETIKGVLRSYVHDKGVGGINGTLWIEDEAGFMHSTHEAFILSLTAKIKVEDMTIKQTRNLQNGKSTFNGNEVLDCTEWGWKK